jgi:tetratricopeptide (TPR) repeat protein
VIRPPSPDDSLLADARAHAAAGAWRELRALLERSPRAETHPELAVLLVEALLWTAEPREARRRLVDAMPVVERDGGAALIRRAANVRGAGALQLGELAEAESAFARALELARYDGDDLLVARATNNLAIIANVQGARDEALTLYQLAVAAYQRIGDSRGLASTFHNMAITFRDLGRLDTADEYERRAIEFAREGGDDRLVAMARTGRAELSLRQGDPALAAAGARRAAHDFAVLPEPVGEANALRLLGAAGLELGQLDDAGAALDRALDLAVEHGSAVVEAEARASRAELAIAVGRAEEARPEALRAIEIFDRLGAAAERDALRRWLAGLDDASDA